MGVTHTPGGLSTILLLTVRCYARRYDDYDVTHKKLFLYHNIIILLYYYIYQLLRNNTLYNDIMQYSVSIAHDDVSYCV